MTEHSGDRARAAGSVSSHAADEGITAERNEAKYLVSARVASSLAKLFSSRLVRHHYTGAGATTLPEARTYITTVYFDTPSWRLLADAKQHAHHLKVRAREYYTLHPSLTPVVTRARQLVRFSAVVWLELKYRDGARVEKRRIGVPKAALAEFFANGQITADLVQLQKPAYGLHAGLVLDEVVGVCRALAEPLGAACVVNYRRSAWQNLEGSLRLTLDRELSFFAPPPDLWSRDFALVRETLGPVQDTLQEHVLEVKSLGAVPAWLKDALLQVGLAPRQFSKFMRAAEGLSSASSASAGPRSLP